MYEIKITITQQEGGVNVDIDSLRNDKTADREQLVGELIMKYLQEYLVVAFKQVPIPERRCRVCGCTDTHACAGGCFWVGSDLCSRCAQKQRILEVDSVVAIPEVAHD